MLVMRKRLLPFGLLRTASGDRKQIILFILSKRLSCSVFLSCADRAVVHSFCYLIVCAVSERRCSSCRGGSSVLGLLRMAWDIGRQRIEDAFFV